MAADDFYVDLVANIVGGVIYHYHSAVYEMTDALAAFIAFFGDFDAGVIADVVFGCERESEVVDV